MTILIVDNEELALEGLCRTVSSVVPDAEICKSMDAEEALALAKEVNPEVAFLDIEMPGMNGLELAKGIKERVNPKINIIFTTGYSEYIREAFTRLRASGYLMKPITKEMVSSELDDLRYPVELKGEKRVRVRAFGYFEIYADNKPMDFRYSKTKEMCAFIIDRGGACRTSELLENLWEETDEVSDHRSYLQNMISDLVKTFTSLGLRDVIIKRYGYVGFDISRIDCDYYYYREGSPAAVNAFRGEYMSQYSWAEETLGRLVFSGD